MPDDEITSETRAPGPEADVAPDAANGGGPGLGLVLIFVGLVLLISIQNLWLRRRASGDTSDDRKES